MPRERERGAPPAPGPAGRLVELPTELELDRCPEDGLVLQRGRWLPWDPVRAAKGAARVRGEAEVWDALPDRDGMIVRVAGWLGEGRRVEERHAIALKWRQRLCDAHQAAAGGYFEATLQLRGDWIGEHFHYIDHRLGQLEEKDRYAFHRDKPVRGGLDVMVGSKQAAWKVAQELKTRFGAKLTRSTKVVGVREGKRLQRLTIAVRFPPGRPLPNIAAEQVGRPLFKP